MYISCSVVLFISIVLVLICEYFAQSPCSKFFELRTDEAGYYGIIHLFPREQVTSISTRIYFTVDSNLNSHYPGRLEPLGEAASLIQQFNQGYPIEYRMHLPVDSPSLQVTSIVVNNDLICSGPPGPPEPDEKVTKLSLSHFLTDRSIHSPERALLSSLKQQKGNPSGLNNLSPYIVITNSQVDILRQGRPKSKVSKLPAGSSSKDPVIGLRQPQTHTQPPAIKGLCKEGQLSRHPSDSTRYRQCRFGKLEELSCTAGQHWNEERKLCDWISNRKSELPKVTTTTTTATTTTESESEEILEEEPVATSPPTSSTPETEATFFNSIIIFFRSILVIYEFLDLRYILGIGV